MHALTVTLHFAGYQPGDQITDAKAMQEVLDSENAEKVVRVALPDSEPESVPQPI